MFLVWIIHSCTSIWCNCVVHLCVHSHVVIYICKEISSQGDPFPCMVYNKAWIFDVDSSTVSLLWWFLVKQYDWDFFSVRHKSSCMRCRTDSSSKRMTTSSPVDHACWWKMILQDELTMTAALQTGSLYTLLYKKNSDHWTKDQYRDVLVLV